MDEQNKAPEEHQPEDLELTEQDAESVKGGRGVTADDDWEAPVGFSPKALSRDGYEHQHNETLIAL